MNAKKELDKYYNYLGNEYKELREELAVIVKDIKYMKGQIIWLESRPPGGGSPPAARVQIRQTQF